VGRYKQHDIIIREFEEVTIVIANRNTIWMLPKKANINVAFHRWYGPLNTYEGWRRFRERMRANRNITLDDCYRLARIHGITTQGSTRSREDIINSIIKARNTR
jgi:hypothetical protein